MTRIALVAALLLGAAALVGVGRPEGADAQQQPAPQARTVTVTGTGSVTSVPDRAQLSFGVETQAGTAKAALRANALEMREVVDAVKAAGAKDVRTQWVVVAPRVDQNGAIVGFVASNSVSVTSEVGKVAALLDAAVEEGANQVSGPAFSAAGAEALYRQALEAAVAQARERAEVLAAASGATLGVVTSVVEGGGGPIAYAKAEAGADAGAATPIEPGQQLTTATATVTFALS